MAGRRPMGPVDRGHLLLRRRRPGLDRSGHLVGRGSHPYRRRLARAPGRPRGPRGRDRGPVAQTTGPMAPRGRIRRRGADPLPGGGRGPQAGHQCRLPARSRSLRRRPALCAAVRRPPRCAAARPLLPGLARFIRVRADVLLFRAAGPATATGPARAGGGDPGRLRLFVRPAGTRRALRVARSRQRGHLLVPAAAAVPLAARIHGIRRRAIDPQPGSRPTRCPAAWTRRWQTKGS